MELRELAERVLFAATLEEKLADGGNVTDERPGLPIGAPEQPGRPPELRFKIRGSGRSGFPGLHALERESERGRLLHFFANHELLATELMALVLLRFPEAPPAFRWGVYQTLRDEQAHTRMYLARMRACGVRFGELPVSGYFWRAVSGMQSPMDYVAGLSLTFEQANLDFCRHFARGFETVGDADTARLLEKIYRDEIGHVAYGLKWFRQWKDPGLDDWEAYRRQLRFPLSPRRARGFEVNAEGRRAAGFDAAFISELEVCSQSKGRTPRVFVFNPFCEGHLSRGPGFAPTSHQAVLAEDLANLPQFLGHEDDVVLVPRRPDSAFLARLRRAGLGSPEFVEMRGGRPDPSAGLEGRKLGGLRPWGWGPDSARWLEPLVANLAAEERARVEGLRRLGDRLYSKAWSADLLGRVLGEGAPEDWLCTRDEVGQVAGSMDAVLECVGRIRARGHHRVVVKEAVGVAGGNALRLWEPEILDAQRRWMERALEVGPVVVEPWLARDVDFSVQWEMGADGLRLHGYAGLINDDRGQYRGNWAEPQHRRRAPVLAMARLGGPPDVGIRVQAWYEQLRERLEPSLRAMAYLGPLGIDAFVYRTADGRGRLKPIVEINPRYTMGRLTLELMNHASPGSWGVFRLVRAAEARSAGFPDLSAYAAALERRHPVQREGRPVSRLRRGALCLNDPERAQMCLAVFRVENRFEDPRALDLVIPERGE